MRIQKDRDRIYGGEIKYISQKSLQFSFKIGPLREKRMKENIESPKVHIPARYLHLFLSIIALLIACTCRH